MKWTEDRVEKLKRLWSDGKSASECAERLGGTTRNAVIGKVNRMKLLERDTVLRIDTKPTPKPTRTRRRLARRTRPRVSTVQPRPISPPMEAIKDPYIPPPESNVIPLKQRRTIQTVTDSVCKWPIGDPKDNDFHLCGAVSVPGKPCCAAHCQRLYVAPKAKKTDTPTKTREPIR